MVLPILDAEVLKNNHNIDLKDVAWPLLVVYLMADLGSIAGGGLSSWLIRRGASVNAARKTAFLVCALGAVPMMFVARINNLWVAVVCLGLAAACDTGFSANLFSIVSTRFRGRPSLPSSALEARPAASACSCSPR